MYRNGKRSMPVKVFLWSVWTAWVFASFTHFFCIRWYDPSPIEVFHYKDIEFRVSKQFLAQWNQGDNAKLLIEDAVNAAQTIHGISNKMKTITIAMKDQTGIMPSTILSSAAGITVATTSEATISITTMVQPTAVIYHELSHALTSWEFLHRAPQYVREGVAQVVAEKEPNRFFLRRLRANATGPHWIHENRLNTHGIELTNEGIIPALGELHYLAIGAAFIDLHRNHPGAIREIVRWVETAPHCSWDDFVVWVTQHYPEVQKRHFILQKWTAGLFVIPWFYYIGKDSEQLALVFTAVYRNGKDGSLGNGTMLVDFGYGRTPHTLRNGVEHNIFPLEVLKKLFAIYFIIPSKASPIVREIWIDNGVPLPTTR